MVLSYQNPVWSGYLADPFVFRSEGMYYAVGTGGPEDDGLQADGRMFPLLRSTDLAHWQHLGGALIALNDPEKPSYWAPEIAERGGRFYLYYSAGGREGQGHQLRVATADHPSGPYRDTGRLLLPDEPFSIDASPFHDPADGRWYLFFAKDFFDGDRPGTGTAVVPLADDMVTPAARVTTVLRPFADWQIFERNRFWYNRVWPAWYTIEGPSVVVHEGRYYCFYSGGRWEKSDYGVGYAVADSPIGPWRDEWDASGPCVLKGSNGKALGPGHNSIVTAPDGKTQLVVYHAWDPTWSARRMCIDPLDWTPDGPRCAGPTTTTQTVELSA